MSQAFWDPAMPGTRQMAFNKGCFQDELYIRGDTLDTSYCSYCTQLTASVAFESSWQNAKHCTLRPVNPHSPKSNARLLSKIQHELLVWRVRACEPSWSDLQV